MVAHIKPLVMLVDDDESVRYVGRKLLNHFGCDVTEFSSGVDAYKWLSNLESTQERKPNMILSDIIMPRLDGIQLAQRAKVILPAVPVVLMSGNIIDQTYSSNVVGVLRKPFSKELCEEAVRKYAVVN